MAMLEKSLLPGFRKYENIREYQVIRPGGAIFFYSNVPFSNIRSEQQY
jgi:hypothetical protein